MSIKRQFNMVEISLAVAVMALGLTLIIGLFPLAIKSHKEVVANTHIPPITDKFVSLIRHRLINNLNTSGTKGEFVLQFTSTDGGNFLKELPTFTNINDTWLTPGKENADYGFIYNSEDNEFRLGSGSRFEAAHTHDDDEDRETVLYHNGNIEDGYIMASLGRFDEGGSELTKTIDFAAHVLLFSDRGIYSDDPFRIGTAENNYDPTFIESEVGRVSVLISWPIDIPMAARTKRCFVIDMFRDRIDAGE